MEIDVTWYGTMCLHFVVNKTFGVVFDPYVNRPATATPRIAARAGTIDLDPLDLILVTHSHFDHVLNLPEVLARYPAAHAYAPARTEKNCRPYAAGETFEDITVDVDESDWARLHTITAGDRVTAEARDGAEGGVRVEAEAIKSRHVKFDKFAAGHVLFNKEVVRHAGKYLRYVHKFHKKEVVGWSVRFRAGDETFHLVVFGSLCKKYPRLLSRFAGCDCFVGPFHGRKDVLPHARGMIDALKPGIVIPGHWDDFFPPITWTCEIAHVKSWLDGAYPRTLFLELRPEQRTRLPTGP